MTMQPSPMRRRSVLAGAAGIMAGSVLAACSNEPETPPSPGTGPELGGPTPATVPGQVENVVGQIHESVTAADEARSAEPLAPRVVGSAADFRTRTYEMIAKEAAWEDQLVTPGTDIVVSVTSVDTEFPRYSIALVSNSKEGEAPFFMALQQNSPRDPYTTWGWSQQAIGVDMPSVEDQTVGTTPIPYDGGEGLLMTPKAALELYAKVMSDGNEADTEDLLAENPFQTEAHRRIHQERVELNEGVEWDEAATIKEIYTVKEDEYVGLGTADGGAIVLGTFMSTRKVNLRNDAVMSYQEDNRYTKLIGKKEFKKEFVREYGTVVTVYIPAAGSDQQVQPIGATNTAIGASGE